MPRMSTIICGVRAVFKGFEVNFLAPLTKGGGKLGNHGIEQRHLCKLLRALHPPPGVRFKGHAQQ
jgi:hypothetical protein